MSFVPRAKFEASLMLDWRRFWKRFHWSFGLNHRVAMQMVVTFFLMISSSMQAFS